MFNILILLSDIIPVSGGIYAVVISILVFAGVVIAGFILYITNKPIAKDGTETEKEAEKIENE